MQRTLLLSFLFLSGIRPLWAQDVKMTGGLDSLSVRGDTVSVAGKRVELDAQGFPGQIQSFFLSGGRDTGALATNILAENIHFHFTRQSDGKDIKMQNGGIVFTVRTPGLLDWETTDSSNELRMGLNASFYSDGSLSYRVKLTALQDLELKEITMHIPFAKGVAKEINGIGLGEDYTIGGILFPPDSTFFLKADTSPAEEPDIWIGTTNAGLRYSLRGEEWRNNGKGGVSIGVKGKSFLANNYSGAHSLKKGDELDYDFDLRITPFKILR